MTKAKDWKLIRISPDAEDILVEWQIRKIKETHKAVSRTEVLNDLILKHKLTK